MAEIKTPVGVFEVWSDDENIGPADVEGIPVAIPVWDEAVRIVSVRIRIAAATPRGREALRWLLERWFSPFPSLIGVAKPLTRALVHPDAGVRFKAERAVENAVVEASAEGEWPARVEVRERGIFGVTAEIVPYVDDRKFTAAYYPISGVAVVVADYVERPTHHHKGALLNAAEMAERSGYGHVDLIEVTGPLAWWPEMPAVPVHAAEEAAASVDAGKETIG